VATYQSEKNKFSDALSRFPIKNMMKDTELEETNSPTDIAYTVMRKKEVQETNFPINQTLITRHQQKDVNLQKKSKNKTPKISVIMKL
jgi:hypothetical protein